MCYDNSIIIRTAKCFHPIGDGGLSGWYHCIINQARNLGMAKADLLGIINSVKLLIDRNEPNPFIGSPFANEYADALKYLLHEDKKVKSSRIHTDSLVRTISTQTEPFFDQEYILRVEMIPIYDYALIKSRRAAIHFEFNSVYRFFSRLIRIRYDTPMAIAVHIK